MDDILNCICFLKFAVTCFFFFPGSHLIYFLTALRIVSRLLGALINQCIWRQSCPRLGQVLRMNKIQTYLKKVGYIAWRKDRPEHQNFPILIGLGITQAWIFAAFVLTYLTLLFILVRHLCLMVLISYFFLLWSLEELLSTPTHSYFPIHIYIYFLFVGWGGGSPFQWWKPLFFGATNKTLEIYMQFFKY